jgi:Fe-S-cluster containining protein
MKLNCEICTENCCGKNVDVNAPILLPHEISKFDVDDLDTKNGVIYRIKRNVDGNCKFLVNGRCGIYDRRPMECRIYPYIFQYKFDNNSVYVKLHDGCSQSNNITETVQHIDDDVKTMMNVEFWKFFMKEPV